MKMLRRALEDMQSSGQQDDAEQTILMKGPLAEIYTKALDVAYAKDNPDAEQPSEADVAVMESQQMDVAVMQKLADALSDGDATPTDNFQTVYGVARDDVTDEVVVDVTKEIVSQASQSDDLNNEFVLIIDATQPGANGDTGSASTERLEMLETALEGLVTAHGGKVYRSLKDYAATRVK